MAAAASQMEKLHFLLIPLMSQSHIIPLTDFAKLLAKRGVTVSIITTPSNAERYNSVKIHAAKSNLKIQLITVDFPGREVGLPGGCENMDSLASQDLFIEFFQASNLLREPMEKIVSELEPKPSCIVCTNALSWTQDIATKFDIPRYVFQTVSCFTNVLSLILKETKAVSDKDTFLIPGVPDNIELAKGQLLENTIKHSDKWENIMDRIKSAHDFARGSLINTFEELEPWYVNEYKKLRKPVWCVGPVSLCNKDTDEKRNRGNRASDDIQDCLSWLDTMKPNSVIYACFGSLCQISPSQLIEIGSGLEASKSPFIWVIRGLNFSSEVEKWLKEDDFEERVKGRALIVRGWAPQVEILSHPSILAFLTHCGWNSTLEGVSAGVPMITFPMFAEQFFNEKFIVNVLKIGVRIGVEVGVNSWQEEKKGVMVKREQVKTAIDCLTGDEGAEMKKRAQKLAKMAKEAVEEGGSSSLNISLLIQDVMQLQGQV